MAFKPHSGALTFCKTAHSHQRGGPRLRGQRSRACYSCSNLGQFYFHVFYPPGFCTRFLLHRSVCYSMKEVEGAVSCVVPDSIHSGQTLHCCGWRITAGAACLGEGAGCCGHPKSSCCCNHCDGSRVSRGRPLCLLHPHCLIPGQIKGKCCLWRYSVTPPALGHSPSSDQEEQTSSR